MTQQVPVLLHVLLLPSAGHLPLGCCWGLCQAGWEAPAPAPPPPLLLLLPKVLLLPLGLPAWWVHPQARTPMGCWTGWAAVPATLSIRGLGSFR
jgi:hypothetical protein